MGRLASRFHHFWRVAGKKASRRWLHWRLRGKPEAERLAAERVLRGREQYRTLREADFVVVSFGKSGRTWLRVMLSHGLRLHYGLPGEEMIGFDNFHWLDRRVAKIFFTHDNYIVDYTGREAGKQPFYDKRVLLLARDPRDTSVSNYFQWKFRMKPEKIKLNNYPPQGSPIGIFEYMMSPYAGGLAHVIDFLNHWAAEAGNIPSFQLLRYEDLKRDTAAALRRVFNFLEVPLSEAHLQAAVEYGSYENMKRMEARNANRALMSGRLAPRDRNNPDSYKVRRAKVGGYRDYLEDDQVAAVDRLVADTLDPFYGYGPGGAC
ncbi:MAG: sulfotransferase [Porticoccaceae bacterium]|nr:MAG: sulfotransferase [Porticoccaceae bacterium]